MSAGVEGMTTVRPGMCASSASRLCECWLPDERPAPNCVRTVSAICAAPPVMNGSLAAWFRSWSRHTPRKSRYISSTTGRMPAIAAPTPSPTIALSEIGVSRTRSPNSSCRPRVSPNTLPPAATSMPATNTPLVGRQLGLERIVHRVHDAEDGHPLARGDLGLLGRGRARTTKSCSVSTAGVGSAARRRDRRIELARDLLVHRVEDVVGDTRVARGGAR